MSTDPREFEHPIDECNHPTPNQLPTVLGVGSLTPEAIESALDAVRAIDGPASIGSEEVSTAALTAAYPFIAAQAKGEALAPILALHRPEKRWTTPDYTGSFDSREEAAELDESDDGPNVDYFEICQECGRIERDWAEDHAEEWTYKLAMWPCKTAVAVLP